MRKTFGSRSISSAMAWPSASRIWRTGMSVPLADRVRVGVLDHVVPGRLGLRVGEGDGLLDRLLGPGLDGVQVLRRDARRLEALPSDEERVVRLPGLDLLLGAVLRR